MEVNLNANVALPQQSQQAPNATSEAGATQTVQNVPDQVVTAATNPSSTSARDDDALRREDRAAREAQVASLQDLQIEGLKTRVGFDQENDTVFLEILAPQSEDVIQRIPSESLVEFLSEQFSQVTTANSNIAQALDRSV